ncbi:amidohydrolase family protein [Fulvivirga sedimenti]|uniref:2-amino-3-carboxymuconate-6-semialdehyde decarboxylase n=1 Tax=Fulvivirga sedimenti TaxID=2879465 RepID=A0A9X1HQ85_9BACT|nr:amidohydrolase family protein [Fulvivirga sedimenti]MCA6074963.1 amidohydrolase [Fulvivirga sedimenti]MCA6076140.1 amidohydrolase [Fulvivirga sedimenti]MCA6077268.1 amidohydrolase [Fulvivirga sedimenti]
MLKIDMHTHIIPKEMPNWTEKFGYGDFIYLQHHRDGFAKMMKGNQFFREIEENCWDAEVRIQEYAAFNTQVQVVCTIPVMFSYWAKPDDCLDLSRFLNDDIAQLCSDYPRNYIGLGTVPMQDTDLAIQELQRCKELGLPGVQIGSNINNENLSEPRFFRFFEACEQLNMAVLVHPWEMMGMQHMTKYWLPWLVGMPAETSRAICSLIFSGTLERLPDLRVNFAHAGGSFLSTLGRVEHGFNCRPDLVAIDNNVPPSSYLGKFWVDCITHDPKMLQYVLDLQGSKRITLGTDYPFPLGDLEIGKFIEDMNLDQGVVEDIFCNATMEWLDLNKEDYV